MIMRLNKSTVSSKQKLGNLSIQHLFYDIASKMKEYKRRFPLGHYLLNAE
jgi:hypothetical protein